LAQALLAQAVASVHRARAAAPPRSGGMSWAALPLAAALGWRLAAGESGWQGSNLTLSTYWDCNGQGCDAETLQPWRAALYVSPPGYGPQDPNDFGGPVYGEAMWLTGAASDALSALLGPDDGCCGVDGNDGGVGGCGRCLLVQNEASLHPEWTAVVMKKSRCPPSSAGCDADTPHFDIAVPGFDYLSNSSSNMCGQPGTGFASQRQSVPLGSWWDLCTSWPCDLSHFEHLCDELPPVFQPGCRLFTSWGWRSGLPSAVTYRTVDCPPEFVEHVRAAFGPDGPGGWPPTPAPNTTAQAPGNSTACATGAWESCQESRCCADEGFTCFAKDAYWSMCLQECAPGEINPDDPREFQTPWSCAVHGPGARPPAPPTAAPTAAPGPTPCSGAWEGCQASRCCASQGFACFQKDPFWAQCRRECTPGEVNPDDPPEYQSPWSCVVLDVSLTETSHSITTTSTSRTSVSGSSAVPELLTYTRSTTSQVVNSTVSDIAPQTESAAATVIGTTAGTTTGTTTAFGQFTIVGTTSERNTQSQSAPGVSATITYFETSGTLTSTKPEVTVLSSQSETSTFSPRTASTNGATVTSPARTITVTGTTQTTSHLRGSSTMTSAISAGPRTTMTRWSSVTRTTSRPTPAACTPGLWTDCTESRCCAEPGLECFEKHEWYAQCRQDCPGGAGWSCRVLRP